MPGAFSGTLRYLVSAELILWTQAYAALYAFSYIVGEILVAFGRSTYKSRTYSLPITRTLTFAEEWFAIVKTTADNNSLLA